MRDQVRLDEPRDLLVFLPGPAHRDGRAQLAAGLRGGRALRCRRRPRGPKEPVDHRSGDSHQLAPAIHDPLDGIVHVTSLDGAVAVLVGFNHTLLPENVHEPRKASRNLDQLPNRGGGELDVEVSALQVVLSFHDDLRQLFDAH
jgi:hypothetical protein